MFQDTLEALHGRSRHHLALRTTNNAVARAVLQERSVPCQEEEGYLILPILSDELAAQLTRLLAERHLGVIRLEERDVYKRQLRRGRRQQGVTSESDWRFSNPS